MVDTPSPFALFALELRRLGFTKRLDSTRKGVRSVHWEQLIDAPGIDDWRRLTVVIRSTGFNYVTYSQGRSGPRGLIQRFADVDSLAEAVRLQAEDRNHAEYDPPCACGDCRDLDDRFPRDGVQLALIPTPAPLLALIEKAGSTPDGGPGLSPQLDTPAAAPAGASDHQPHGRGRSLAATTTGDDR